jgi:hypothetical protein
MNHMRLKALVRATDSQNQAQPEALYPSIYSKMDGVQEETQQRDQSQESQCERTLDWGIH